MAVICWELPGRSENVSGSMEKGADVLHWKSSGVSPWFFTKKVLCPVSLAATKPKSTASGTCGEKDTAYASLSQTGDINRR